MCACVSVCLCPRCPEEISGAAAVKTTQSSARTHTQYEHTHAHQQYMWRILFFLHNLQSLHPSLLPSLALSFSLICSELNYTRMHTHIHADSKNTHTSLLSFPSELQSGRQLQRLTETEKRREGGQTTRPKNRVLENRPGHFCRNYVFTWTCCHLVLVMCDSFRFCHYTKTVLWVS